MEHYIDKKTLVEEINRQHKKLMTANNIYGTQFVLGFRQACRQIIDFLNTLEVKDPYEQTVQYDSIKVGIQAHAETYSFNIESKLFNQLTEEQQKLWRKEIEQACISGGDAGVELARDARYKENLEVKEVDLKKEIDSYFERFQNIQCDEDCCNEGGFCCVLDNDLKIVDIERCRKIARHFFELGLKVSNVLTWEDMKQIRDIMVECSAIGLWSKPDEEYYQEVVKRFKVQKGE